MSQPTGTSRRRPRAHCLHARGPGPRRAAATLAALLALAAAAPAQRGPARLIRLEAGALSPQVASALALDVASHDGALRPDRPAEVIAYADDLRALRRLGVPYTVAVPDLEAFYAARLVPGGAVGIGGAAAHGAWLQPPFAQGGMGGYYTLAELGAVLDQIHAAYPALTTAVRSIGSSLEGRPLWMLKVSDHPGVDEDEPEVRIDALHHAREPEGMQASLWFLLWLLESYGTDPVATYLVEERELYFVPCVNPDGYAHNQATNPGGGGLWRKNRRDLGNGVFGVDLNRNYTSFWGWDDLGSSPAPTSETYRGARPASEPEVAAMEAFFARRSFATALSVHTWSDLWLHPYGHAQVAPANLADYDQVSELATARNGYEHGSPIELLYPVNGDVMGHEHEVHGTMAWAPEIGGLEDGFWPATGRIVPLAEENLDALRTTALAAGAQVLLDPLPEELGDGDGFLQPGEAAVWGRARNVGREASPPVTVTLSSSSPWATATVASSALGVVAPFGAVAAAVPVRLDLAPGTPPGTVVPYKLTVTHPGLARTLRGRLVVGTPRPWLVDPVETGHGWVAGLPADTATDGVWEHGDPVGTGSATLLFNPEDDATPDPGVKAFVTGNGGGSIIDDDVDGGLTTLLSPLLDLSGLPSARIGYARWFMVTEGRFEVALSNDGGASWHPLEVLQAGEQGWVRVNHVLDGSLPLTERMRLRFSVEARPLDLQFFELLVEAGVDDLLVEVYE